MLATATLWQIIETHATKADKKLAAVAYVTSNDKVGFGKGDTLITDASDKAVADGQTSAKILARAKERGADLYSCDGLHAKVIVLGGWAVIGSANLSHRSESLVEAAWVTNDLEAVNQVTSWINELKKQATPIDDLFLQRIQHIPVNPSTGDEPTCDEPTNDEPTTRDEHRQFLPTDRGWILGVTTLPGEDAAEGQEIINQFLGDSNKDKASNYTPIKIDKRCNFRDQAAVGDLVIQFWHPDTRTQVPDWVYQPVRIQFRQNEAQCTWFVVDAAPKETALTWVKFQWLWRSVTGEGNLWPTDELRLDPPRVLGLHTRWPEAQLH
jgi:hypothetical protein